MATATIIGTGIYTGAITETSATGATGVVWGDQTLDLYLENPRNVVKGTKMAFPGLKKPQDRTDLIAFLNRLTGSRQ